jgi:hypothetical protein
MCHKQFHLMQMHDPVDTTSNTPNVWAYDNIVLSSSLAPPSDSDGFWNPPWSASPTVSDQDTTIPEGVSEGAVPSEGDPKRELSPWWDPLALLSPPSPTPFLYSITCVTATPRCPPTTKIAFDTDSGAMGIENRCSVCMSHIKADFVGELIQDRLA